MMKPDAVQRDALRGQVLAAQGESLGSTFEKIRSNLHHPETSTRIPRADLDPVEVIND